MARIVVHCQPGARRTRIAGVHDGKPRIQLNAPPVDGEANKALIAFVAGLCGVPKSAIRIEAGASSRTKRIAVEGVDEDTLRALMHSPDHG